MIYDAHDLSYPLNKDLRKFSLQPNNYPPLTSNGKGAVQHTVPSGQGGVSVVPALVVVVSDIEAGEFAVLYPQSATGRVNVLSIQRLQQGCGIRVGEKSFIKLKAC